MSKHYQVRRFGFWVRPLLVLDDDGFEYRGRRYSSGDVIDVRTAGGNDLPIGMGVELADGRRIQVDAEALLLDGKKEPLGFRCGSNEAFEQLRRWFEGCMAR